MQAGERASMRVSSSVLFSPLSSPLLFFGALFSTRRQAACRQFVSLHQSHLCSNVVAVSSDSVVSWNIFLASGEKVSES